jgi:hypothetical protein
MANPKGLRKVSLNLYLDRAEYEQLRELSLRTHVTQQWYLRAGVRLILEQERAKLRSA